MIKIYFVSSLFILLAFTTQKPKATSFAELDTFMNDWHKAASEANWKNYEVKMDADFVFLGTDPTERWNKKEFESFAKPYFDQGKAWDFKVKSRNWQISADGKTVWFDEILDTWMRDCRATGVLFRRGKEWKIIHYNLHVLIENSKIRSFIQLRDQKTE